MGTDVKRIYNQETLFELVNKKYSCIVKNRMVRKIELMPKYFGKVKAGLKEALDNGINKYDYSLNGVLLDYRGLTVLAEGDSGRIIGKSGDFVVSVAADFYIFQPNVGSLLEGEVHVKRKTHIGCLVHKRFNAMIVKPDDVEDDEWHCQNIKIGNKVIMKIVDHVFSSKVPYIVGKLVDELPGEAEESSKKTGQTDTVVHSKQNGHLSDEGKVGKEVRKLNFDIEDDDSCDFVTAYKKITVTREVKDSSKKSKKGKEYNLTELDSTINPESTLTEIKGKKKRKKKDKDKDMDESYTEIEKEEESLAVSSGLTESEEKRKKKKRKKDKSEISEDSDAHPKEKKKKKESSHQKSDSVLSEGDNVFSPRQESSSKMNLVKRLEDSSDKNAVSVPTRTTTNKNSDKSEETVRVRTQKESPFPTKRKREEGSFRGESPILGSPPSAKKNCTDRKFNSSEVSLFSDYETNSQSPLKMLTAASKISAKKDAENSPLAKRSTSFQESSRNAFADAEERVSPVRNVKSPGKGKKNTDGESAVDEVEGNAGWPVNTQKSPSKRSSGKKRDLDEGSSPPVKTQKKPIRPKNEAGTSLMDKSSLFKSPEKLSKPDSCSPSPPMTQKSKSVRNEQSFTPSKKDFLSEFELQEKLWETDSASPGKTQKSPRKLKNEKECPSKMKSEEHKSSDSEETSAQPKKTHKKEKKKKKNEEKDSSKKKTVATPKPSSENVETSKMISPVPVMHSTLLQSSEKSKKVKGKEDKKLVGIQKFLVLGKVQAAADENARLKPKNNVSKADAVKETKDEEKTKSKKDKKDNVTSADPVDNTSDAPSKLNKKEEAAKKVKKQSLENDNERQLMINALMQHMRESLGIKSGDSPTVKKKKKKKKSEKKQSNDLEGFT